MSLAFNLWGLHNFSVSFDAEQHIDKGHKQSWQAFTKTPHRNTLGHGYESCAETFLIVVLIIVYKDRLLVDLGIFEKVIWFAQMPC